MQRLVTITANLPFDDDSDLPGQVSARPGGAETGPNDNKLIHLDEFRAHHMAMKPLIHLLTIAHAMMIAAFSSSADRECIIPPIENLTEVIVFASAATPLQAELPEGVDEALAGDLSILWWALLATILLLVIALLHQLRKLRKMEVELGDERQKSEVNREMREVLQERVDRLQRMESLGMLAGGVAHDFNNLLVGVICNAEVLDSQDSQLDDFAKQRVSQIIDSAEKAAGLSRQMLAYVGNTRSRRLPVDLNRLAENMKRVLSATAGPDMEITFDFHRGPLTAEVDETQIEQVLLNLVSNARRASHDRGKIVISTGSERLENVESDSTLFGTPVTDGEFVFIGVQDYGDGIREADQSRIFEPFFSARRDGRGIGLSVVKGIVSAHEGIIRLQSCLNEGTCFQVLLPRTTADVSDAPIETARATKVGRKHEMASGTVLVVDDEPTVSELAGTLLRMDNWTVESVNSGRLAIEKLATDQRFSCMLLDVVMDDMGADEVLAELDRRGINLPVVLMSGYSSKQLDQFRNHRQVVSILEKPFRAAELADAVKRADAEA